MRRGFGGRAGHGGMSVITLLLVANGLAFLAQLAMPEPMFR